MAYIFLCRFRSDGDTVRFELVLLVVPAFLTLAGLGLLDRTSLWKMP